MNKLESIIIEKIRSNGPLSFAEFMETALYHPVLGYYSSDRKKLGFDGDFFTSCTLTPVFGYSLAAQLLEMWRLSGIRDFTIVEYGAGTGELCAAVFDFFAEIRSELPGKLKYKIIEISDGLRDVQRAKLPSEVEWITSISEVSGFEGAVISNELLDNFPVYRVCMRDELMEIRVGYNSAFTEIEVPAGGKLVNYFDRLKVKLPAGFITEVCLSAEAWMEDIAKAMGRGFVMTIDYGFLSGDLYAPSRSAGTLAAYHRHKVVQDLYANVGSQDISAYVNFSALALFAMNNGLQLSGYREQGPFLRALAFERRLADMKDRGMARDVRRENAILQTVMGEMGSKFKVLVLQKLLPALKLTGFSGKV